MNPKIATLCLLRRGDTVCLAMKSRGFGNAWWNGYGGKVAESEMIPVAAVRELKEEARVVAEEKDLEKVAIISFYFKVPEGEQLKFIVHVFMVHEFAGMPKATEEMQTPTWFKISEIPWAEMFSSDVIWLRKVLAGEKFSGEIHYNENASETLRVDFKPLH